MSIPITTLGQQTESNYIIQTTPTVVLSTPDLNSLFNTQTQSNSLFGFQHFSLPNPSIFENQISNPMMNFLNNNNSNPEPQPINNAGVLYPQQYHQPMQTIQCNTSFGSVPTL
jgi:hypothetical protein